MQHWQKGDLQRTRGRMEEKKKAPAPEVTREPESLFLAQFKDAAMRKIGDFGEH